MACSIPPMYWSTGSQRLTSAEPKIFVSSREEMKRQKYHDEATNVAIGAASGRAASARSVTPRARPRPPPPARGGEGGAGGGVGGATRHNHDLDRQPVLLRKLEIALVVPRHGHDRAGAVLHQHEVAEEDRDLLVRERIDRALAGEAPFLPRLLPLEVALVAHAGDPLLDVGALRVVRDERGDVRVLRR